MIQIKLVSEPECFGTSFFMQLKIRDGQLRTAGKAAEQTKSMPPQSSRLGWHAFLKLGLCLDLRAVVLTVCAWYLSNFWQQSRLWCGPVYQAHFLRTLQWPLIVLQ
jgi:hypothetical protein